MNRNLLLLLALAACAQAKPLPPLEGAAIGGPFTLVREDGATVTDASFAGKYRIVYFGYTYCPDVCPTDVAKLMAGYRAFAKIDAARAAQIVPVFVSIDPARDTPEKVREFTDAFDPALVGLTGSKAQVAAAARAYGVAYSAQPATGAGGYLVDHARAAYLMDPAGKPLALLPQDGAPQAIADEIAKWVT